MGGAERTPRMVHELATKKVDTILAKLKTVLRMGRGVPFKRIQKLVGKLCHALSESWRAATCLAC